MSSRSNGVMNVEFSRERIAWVRRSPSCSASARRLAFISGSTKSSTMSSSSRAASARLPGESGGPGGSAVEAVADPADGDDQLGIVAVLFEAGAQALDVNVEGL